MKTSSLINKIILLLMAGILIFMMTGCSIPGLAGSFATGANAGTLAQTENEQTTTEPMTEPDPPKKIVHQLVKQGNYYIRNIDSEYVYFSAPLVYAANVIAPEDPEQDSAAQPETVETEVTAAEEVTSEAEVTDVVSDTEYTEETENTDIISETEDTETAAGTEETEPDTTVAVVVNYRMRVSNEAAPAAAEEGETAKAEEKADNRMINNLQLEVLGEDLPYFELRFDPEGYAYFTMKGTDRVLGFEGDLKNGANVLLQDMDRIIYPQYENWPDPLYRLADNQRWIVNKLEDGSYVICSAVNTEYVMTIDDRYGIHFANIMMWRYDERNQQKFYMENSTPKVEITLEEGSYFIRTGMSSYMMISIGDYNFDSGRAAYMYHSDGLDGQVFTVTYDKYGLATITHSDSNMALSVENGDAINDQKIAQYESDGEDWQKWILEKSGDDGGYIIRSARNVSEVMYVSGGIPAELQSLCTYWENGSSSQRWYFLNQPPEGVFSYNDMLNYAQNYSSATDYLILINSLTNHVGIYRGYKGNWTCEQYWDCVTGSYSSPTVKGEFQVVGRVESFDGDTDAPEEYTCYYATMFYPAYFFHSIIYYKGTKNIMDATMGWNASHGCVRLYIENAQWIYDNIPDGTKVVSF